MRHTAATACVCRRRFIFLAAFIIPTINNFIDKFQRRPYFPRVYYYVTHRLNVSLDRNLLALRTSLNRTLLSTCKMGRRDDLLDDFSGHR